MAKEMRGLKYFLTMAIQEGGIVEDLTLTGTAAISGTGNTLNNVIITNAGNNVLNGGAGTDTVSYVAATAGVAVSLSIATAQATGGSGSDTLSGFENLTGSSFADTLTGAAATNILTGGAGNDTYVVQDSADAVVELAGEGTDAVQSSVTYVLSANVENLILTGTANINATGNDLDNVLTGNTGTNTLAGGAGNDTYVVQNTADIVSELANEGIDIVQSWAAYTLSNNVEDLTLTGSSAINGTGNSFDNVLTGNTGANTLTGGAGNDTYIIQNTTDVVVEAAGGGTDTVQSSVTHTLSAEVENLTLTGSNSINGTGNSLNNVLTGNSGTNTLTGGAGNDTYFIQNTSDVVTEAAGGGKDTVHSSGSHTLSAEVESLILSGTAANATGNTLANAITGNDGANTINGRAGSDTLFGGLGADTFVFNTALGATNIDVISDFAVVDDTMHLENTGTGLFNALASGAVAANAFRTGSTAQAAADRIIYNSATGRLYYDADGTGATAQIQFAAVAAGLAMTAAEFVVV